RAAGRRAPEPADRVHGHARGRDGRGHRGQLVARVSVLRRVISGGDAGDPARALRRRLRRRRRRLASLPSRDSAGAPARPRRDDRAVVHPHHQRLQYRLRDDAWRPPDRDPGIRDVLLRSRVQPAPLGPGGDDLDLSRPRARRRHRAGEPLSAPGARVSPSARALTIAGLIAFLLIVLVPFWWIASMSFKTYEQVQFATSIYVPRPFTWENYTV